MRRKLMVTCGAGLLLLLVLFAQNTRSPEDGPTQPQASVEQMHLPVPEPADPASASGAAEKEALDGGGYYVLKAYMDRLAVYRVYPDGTQVLANLIDMDINVLPKKDVESLHEGIILRSDDALIRILEDFMS